MHIRIYKAINGILTALITRIINCSDVIAENILSPELLQGEKEHEEDGDIEKEKQEEVPEDFSESDTDIEQEIPVEPEDFDSIHEEHEDPDEEDLLDPPREPSNYYVLDFSYVKKENYHK